MSELKKIVSLFDELQYGECWIGTHFKKVLLGLDEKKALERLTPDGNNAWQLLNHVSYWRDTMMLRLSGRDAYPAYQDFLMPGKTDKDAWQLTLENFDKQFQTFRNTILSFDLALINKPSPRADRTYYELMIGCLQHDSYHLGQMQLLSNVASI